MLEDRILNEALLDDERRIPDRRNDDRQDEGLERAHVIADEHAGSLKRAEVVDAVDLDPDACLLKGAQYCKAACAPLRPVILSVLRLPACLKDDPYHAGVKGQRRREP